MKTIQEVINYLENELESKKEKMNMHYDMYKKFENTNDTLIKETSKEYYIKYAKECMFLEDIITVVKG